MALIILIMVYFSVDQSVMAETKTINKSNENYWISFISNNSGVTGHAFVKLKDLEGNTQAVGKYPENDRNPKILTFGKVPGKIIDETECNPSNNHTLNVQVSKKVFNYVLTNINAMKTGPDQYDLNVDSCVDFVELAAGAISLKLPNKSKLLINLPEHYMAELNSLN